MTDQRPPKKVGVSRKVFVSFAVLFMLVIAPAVSYVYLKKGFDYRLESIDQLKEKEISSELRDFIDSEDSFIGNARLIHIPSSNLSEEIKVLDVIDERIVDRTRFDIVSFASEPSAERDDNIDFKSISTNAPSEYQFLLLDTSNAVRAVYPYTKEVGKDIMRHLSVVIPVPTKREITLLRDTL